MFNLVARRGFRHTSLLGTHAALSRLASAWASQKAGPSTELSGSEADLSIRKQRLQIAGGRL